MCVCTHVPKSKKFLGSSPSLVVRHTVPAKYPKNPGIISRFHGNLESRSVSPKCWKIKILVARPRKALCNGHVHCWHVQEHTKHVQLLTTGYACAKWSSKSRDLVVRVNELVTFSAYFTVFSVWCNDVSLFVTRWCHVLFFAKVSEYKCKNLAMQKKYSESREFSCWAPETPLSSLGRYGTVVPCSLHICHRTKENVKFTQDICMYIYHLVHNVHTCMCHYIEA